MQARDQHFCRLLQSNRRPTGLHALLRHLEPRCTSGLLIRGYSGPLAGTAGARLERRPELQLAGFTGRDLDDSARELALLASHRGSTVLLKLEAARFVGRCRADSVRQKGRIYAVALLTGTRFRARPTTDLFRSPLYRIATCGRSAEALL